ncbi:hypothetical protein PO878_10060 [Iamia majanohamensis]|uniref:Flp family type IVb pilin n=1 Tax=Iamia majanohamensis TaxID=467976 RepID=A0AAF0BXR5_9ACTN|nr:hypothetical protein [Iamia majanohamensis]WCO69069.1 hypothetical protein PO878_10060 [Iamia majanohamensis]
MLQTLHRLQARSGDGERGASLVEYALLLALVVFVCVGALTYFGTENSTSTDSSGSCIKAAYAGEALPAGCD